VQNQKDLIVMKELLESGKVLPVIDGCYPLSKTAEALRYFEKVHARGKVVIIVEQQKEGKNEKDLYIRDHFDGSDSLRSTSDSGDG
jgi:hypothetical protein